MDYRDIGREVKEASRLLGALPRKVRDAALEEIALGLQERREEIFAANRRDLEAGQGLPGPILGRLTFDEHKLSDVTAGIRGLIGLEDPVGQVLLERELDEGLILRRVTCPIGVIGVIFESRPDALVQIASLCIKSGNGAILKGGSEARHTNRALFDSIYEAGLAAGLPAHFAALIEDRAGIDELIRCPESIDLLIPRGSNAFVKYIMDHSEIPVMGHADGICHVYVDRDADLQKAIPVILDAKTQYVAACNTAETLLVHRDVAQQVQELLDEANDRAAQTASGKASEGPVPKVPIQFIPAFSEEDYREYLDYKMTVKVVASPQEAIAHINRYGSHHTDAILTENEDTARLFLNLVDSAGVYWNASTRFADGFRYGFGAEVGISTGKLPPRGPVGLDGLVTYKYQLTGEGHIVGDYASGKKSFHFRDVR